MPYSETYFRKGLQSNIFSSKVMWLTGSNCVMLIESVTSGWKDNTDPMPDMEELTACLIFYNFVSESVQCVIQWIKATDSGGFVSLSAGANKTLCIIVFGNSIREDRLPCVCQFINALFIDVMMNLGLSISPPVFNLLNLSFYQRDICPRCFFIIPGITFTLAGALTSITFIIFQN